MFLYRKRLLMVAHREEEVQRTLAGVPSIGGSGLFSAKSLQKQYNILKYFFLFTKIIKVYNCFKTNNLRLAQSISSNPTFRSLTSFGLWPQPTEVWFLTYTKF